MVLETLKHWLIRTPLEGPLQSLRGKWQRRKLRRNPELAELFAESDRIDEVLRRALRGDSNCVDVGAHLGSMLGAMLRLSPDGQHIAIEPVPHKAQWLRKKFPEVSVHAMCLSDKTGTVTFTHNISHSGYSGLAGGGEPGDKVMTLEVPCKRLDDLLPNNHRVDFLKVDVEGAECDVLAGARETIRRCRPLILFECTPDGLKNFNMSARDVWHRVTSDHGYSVMLAKDFLSNGQPLTADAFTRAIEYPPLARNFVAIPA